MSVSKALALMLVLGLPAFAADGMTLRNDGRTTVVVQTGTLLRGKLKSDQPVILKPGESTPDVPLDADKMVTVYDGKSNRILFQAVQRASKASVHYGIQPDPRLPGKVRLVPIRRAMGGP